jgi:hypothetical protein
VRAHHCGRLDPAVRRLSPQGDPSSSHRALARQLHRSCRPPRDGSKDRHPAQSHGPHIPHHVTWHNLELGTQHDPEDLQGRTSHCDSDCHLQRGASPGATASAVGRGHCCRTTAPSSSCRHSARCPSVRRVSACVVRSLGPAALRKGAPRRAIARAGVPAAPIRWCDPHTRPSLIPTHWASRWVSAWYACNQPRLGRDMAVGSARDDVSC